MQLIILLLAFVCSVYCIAPLYGSDNPDKIPGQYIVIFHENTTTDQITLRSKAIGSVMFNYNIGDTFKGFAAKLGDEMVGLLRGDPTVKEIHLDGVERVACDTTQNGATWGISRVSHYGRFGQDGVSTRYYHSTVAAGQNVNIYIIDTGIFIEHNDFQGRAKYGQNFVDTVDTDQNGHGTHCAGTAAGATWGIAKKANLIAVKVLGAGGSGATSGVIAGINWVTQQHVAGNHPSVASMSLGSSTDGGKNAAIAASSRQGVVYSVAAGNSRANACNFYPCSAPDAICVGSTAIGDLNGIPVDVISTFSNFGTCVDIFAPGTSITSCSIRARDASSVLSGTSMACPHVTGAIAVHLSINRNQSPAQVKQYLRQTAQSGLIQEPGTGSPNLLLYNGC